MQIIKSFLLILILVVSGCKDETLLNGLDQIQANEVVALLQKHNIDAKKTNMGKAGYSVYVKIKDFSTAVDFITVYNFPSKPRIEIAEMFPSDTLISSPRAEQARIYSAIEQRLEQTLNQINGIVSSRVHVSYDLSNLDSDIKRKQMHIAILLRHIAIFNVPGTLITDVTRLVKNSFANIEYDNISVILTPVPDSYQFTSVQVKQDELTYGQLIVIVTIILILVLASFFMYKWQKNSA